MNLNFETMQRGTRLWTVKGERFTSVTFVCVDRLPHNISVKVICRKRSKRITDGIGLYDDNGKLELRRSFFKSKYSELVEAALAQPTPAVADLAKSFDKPVVAIRRILGLAVELGFIPEPEASK